MTQQRTSFIGLDDPSAPRGFVRNSAKEREARRLEKEIAKHLMQNGVETPSQDQEKAVGLQAMDVVLGVSAANDHRSIGGNGSTMAESPFVGARKQLQQRLDVLRGPAAVHSLSSPTSSAHSPPPSTPLQMQSSLGSRQPTSPASPRMDASGGLFGATSYSAFFGGLAGVSGGDGGGSNGGETPAHVKYPATDEAADEDTSFGQLDSMFAGMAGVVGLHPAKGKEYVV